MIGKDRFSLKEFCEFMKTVLIHFIQTHLDNLFPLTDSGNYVSTAIKSAFILPEYQRDQIANQNAFIFRYLHLFSFPFLCLLFKYSCQILLYLIPIWFLSSPLPNSVEMLLKQMFSLTT